MTDINPFTRPPYSAPEPTPAPAPTPEPGAFVEAENTAAENVDEPTHKVGDAVRWSEVDYYSAVGHVESRVGVIIGVVDTDEAGKPLEVPVLDVAWINGGFAAIAADQVS